MEHATEIRQKFDESFKRKVIEEYLATNCSKMSLLHKYDIHFKSAIQTWMKKLGYLESGSKKSNFRPINKFTLNSDKTVTVITDDADKEIFQKRIKELECQLADEQLLKEMYEKMIIIAEDELKIPIRKKYSTR